MTLDLIDRTRRKDHRSLTERCCCQQLSCLEHRAHSCDLKCLSMADVVVRRCLQIRVTRNGNVFFTSEISIRQRRMVHLYAYRYAFVYEL